MDELTTTHNIDSETHKFIKGG